MFQAGLQLDQAPPISVPFRFFLSAPVFVVLAALVLLAHGPELFESAQSPAAMAATHLFTLGFLSMVMMGAVMQMLPVLAGAAVPAARMTAGISHVGLVLGALLLASGFLYGQPWLLKAGVVALAVAFGVFIAAVAVTLWRACVISHTVSAMRFAAVALLVATIIGIMVASTLAWGLAIPNMALRSLHPGWAIFGWVGLLAIGVAYQVVPMFQMTPAYPEPMMKFLAGTVFALLALWSVALWQEGGMWGWWAKAFGFAIAFAYVVFAVTTAVLQQRRRRRTPDVTLDFWRVGMGSLIIACAVWAVRILVLSDPPDGLDVSVGLLALFGFTGSIITGMLYKIAPFLVWFHLQSVTGAGRVAPNMKKILGDREQRIQFTMHAVTLALLLASAAWPAAFSYPAALTLAMSGVLLAANLFAALRVYREFPATLQSTAGGVPR